jgi:hypothetical protein
LRGASDSTGLVKSVAGFERDFRVLVVIRKGRDGRNMSGREL